MTREEAAPYFRYYGDFDIPGNLFWDRGSYIEIWYRYEDGCLRRTGVREKKIKIQEGNFLNTYRLDAYGNRDLESQKWDNAKLENTLVGHTVVKMERGLFPEEWRLTFENGTVLRVEWGEFSAPTVTVNGVRPW